MASTTSTSSMIPSGCGGSRQGQERGGESSAARVQRNNLAASRSVDRCGEASYLCLSQGARCVGCACKRRLASEFGSMDYLDDRLYRQAAGGARRLLSTRDIEAVGNRIRTGSGR